MRAFWQTGSEGGLQFGARFPLFRIRERRDIVRSRADDGERRGHCLTHEKGLASTVRLCDFDCRIMKGTRCRSPLQTRRLNGAINRVPTNLYDRVWQILERTKEGIVIAGNFLPQVAI